MTTNVPLYKTVKDALKRQIETAVFKVGDQLPGEAAIAQAHSCSRLTAHRALRELATEGYVERRRRAGTRVLPRDKGGVLIAIPSIKDEIEATGKQYGYELLHRRYLLPPASISHDLRTAPDQKLLNIRCLHRADTTVLQYENRWINPSVAEGALERSFEKTSPNLWLLTHVPYSDVNHTITSVAATATEAKLMGLPTGSALLRVRRQTFLYTVGVTAVTLLHPGRDYSLRSNPVAAPTGTQN